MAHFAKVENNIVVNVIVAEQGFIDTLPDADSWVQTSYNTRGGVHYSPETGEPDGGVALRKNYAGIGFTYDKTRDAFIPPQSFASWTLNEDSCLWEAPTERPENIKDPNGKMIAGYFWNEEDYASGGSGWVLEEIESANT
jgi:hypothetical protein